MQDAQGGLKAKAKRKSLRIQSESFAMWRRVGAASRQTNKKMKKFNLILAFLS